MELNPNQHLFIEEMHRAEFFPRSNTLRFTIRLINPIYN